MAGLVLSPDGLVLHAPSWAAFWAATRTGLGPLAAEWHHTRPFFDLPDLRNPNATQGELEKDYEKLLEIANECLQPPRRMRASPWIPCNGSCQEGERKGCGQR
jgi:hypothetical protein